MQDQIKPCKNCGCCPECGQPLPVANPPYPWYPTPLPNPWYQPYVPPQPIWIGGLNTVTCKVA